MTRVPLVPMLLVCATGAFGCAQTDSSLTIVQMQELSLASKCVISGTPAVGLSRGTLDVSLTRPSGYVAAPLVKSNLQSRIVGTSPERNGVDLTGVDVRLLDTKGQPAPVAAAAQKFFYPASGGHIDPQGSVGAAVELISRATADSLKGLIPASGVYTLIAGVRPVGMATSDQLVGGEIEFPIDLCSGCLVTSRSCPFPAGTMVRPGGCNPGQDDPIDCCVDASGAVLCGSLAPVGP